MIEALLKGKLSREQANMEDILTSNVFGLLRYVSPELGLFRFLGEATTCEGDRRLDRLRDECAVQRDSVAYEFWPLWPGRNGAAGCELDVVIHVPCDRGSSYLIGIEAKYRSGKSSEGDERARGPTDQLAREWHALAREAKNCQAQPVLIYLTADVSCPHDQLKASIADCRKDAAGLADPLITWLSWRCLRRLFLHAADSHLRDIASLAESLDLVSFEKISALDPIQIEWQFRRAPPKWRLKVGAYRAPGGSRHE